MKTKPFAHLHVHTEYSLLDGSSKIEELILRCKELGMDSIAITDHGVMYGVIDFYKCAIKNGIKPILGCEVYVASNSRHDKQASSNNFYYHLVLLAENNEGYQNLIKLVSYGFTEGFYYKPRIDMELLRKHNKGLIALSACLAGPVAKTVLNVSYEKAKEVALEYAEIFGEGNFFLELQDHGISEQTTVNQALLRLHKETGLPLVCTNDIHYINQEDAAAHDVLLCIQTGKYISDTDRMKYEGDQFYLKSPEQMYSLFPYAKEALGNTQAIADRCNVSFEFNKYKLPVFDVPQAKTAFEYLKELCEKGLKERYGEVTEELLERLNYELDTISQMGFVDYFLIVWDFIRYAKDNDIIVGPGRGSAAGSIVAYCLRITDIDPIHYSLIFERFLNPERVSMPDIDIDFCYERRQEVIDYVVEKYGADHVSQIITFGTMAAKNAIRDVGRALAIPYQDVDKIAKMIPNELKMTINKALSMNPELKGEYQNNPVVQNLIDMSVKLEGLPRHSSTHAAGVVICDKPVMEYVPLNTNDGVITTQFPMTTCEELGLLKMDFLGLRTLTVIQNAFKEVNRIHRTNYNSDNIDYNDAEVFKMISSGKTEGVFQLESAGMTSFMKELEPQSIEDVIAGISLYRPGPMDFIPKYIKNKNNPDKVEYLHPRLEPILKATYGCIVYQEQVMQIVRELAGYSLGRSDLVRRAMSKKKEDVMAMERKNFIYGTEGVKGCNANGIPTDIASRIFDEMTDFAKYAFNKSHAACYAVVAYQTAWLKLHYPVEFMAALLSSVMDNTSKVTAYIATLKRLGISLLAPDINEGFGNFSVSNGKIRFGLSAIKAVGKGNIAAIVKEREKNGPFKSLTHFLDRLSGELNTRCIESLIKAGAFDSLGGRRSQYLAIYKQVYTGIGQTRKKTVAGQISLFDFNSQPTEDVFKDILPDIKEYPKKERLALEKEVLGMYISGHPLEEYIPTLNRYTSADTTDFLTTETPLEEAEGKISDGQNVIVGGIISGVSVKYTKNNKAMAFLSLEDMYSGIEIIVFPDIYSRQHELIKEDSVILVHGKASVSEDQGSKIIAERLVPYDDIAVASETLWLKISKTSAVAIEDIIGVVKEYPGKTPIKVYDEKTGQKLALDKRFNANLTNELSLRLNAMLGEGCVIVKKA